jgi:hypothetical protein
MSITIDATAGGSSANSYISWTDAVAYFTDLPGFAWNALDSTDDIRKTALVVATRQIDQLRFIGRKYGSETEGATDYQTLEWPRRANSASEFPNSERGTGLPYSRNQAGELIVPKQVREACALQANYLLETTSGIGEMSDREKLIREGVSSISVPGMTESYQSGGKRRLSHLSPEVVRLIGKFIQSGGRLERG